MTMKEHILLAMQELFQVWDKKLSSLNEDQICRKLTGSDWSIKDVLVHLWAWQQRTLARTKAAAEDREPVMPVWFVSPDTPNVEVDLVNAWIYETYKDKPWTEVLINWEQGFQGILQAVGQVSEANLLDAGRYPWLNDNALAYYLISSYDHHREHEEMLAEALS
jgi:hypothetical protein